MSTTTRITMTIPNNLLSDLDFISRSLGLSRSGLICEILSGNVSSIREIIELSIPPDSLDSDSPQLRKPEKIRSYIDSILTAVDQHKSNLVFVRDDLLGSDRGGQNEH